VLLAAQMALLGRVTPQIRGVTCGWDSTTIMFRVISDGSLPEDDRDDLGAAASEIVSHFTAMRIEAEFLEESDDRDLQPLMLCAWVYRRKDPH
jgi:hypothetical protein